MNRQNYLVPGFIGLIIVLVVMPGTLAFSMSSGGYSSSSSLSFDSSSGISSTSVSSISAPSQNQPAPSQQVQSPKFLIPPSWILDVNTASFFDPVTNTAWVFDRVLQKFYSPQNGWYLVTIYPSTGSPAIAYEQFYYNPLTREFFDVTTGLLLQINPLSRGSPIPSTISAAPSQSAPSSVSTSTSLTSITGNTEPIVAGGLGEEAQGSFMPYIYYPDEGGMNDQAQDSFLPKECPVISCPDCYEGYCIDCDENGVCDDFGDML